MDSKVNIHQLIKQGKIKEAIDAWLQATSTSDPIREKLDAYESRLSKLNRKKTAGSISFEDETIVENQLTEDMFSSLKDWRPGGDFASLLYAIEQLGIDPDNEISSLHLVNCDRTGQAITFRRVFNRWEGKSDFQFHFICGCPTEMPTSFGKRLIYEIIRDKLDDRHDAISYPFQEDADQIKTENLPLGTDLATSRKRLKEYVARRFQFSDTQSFETFIETGVPKLPYDYVTAVFEISEKKWEKDEGEIREYLEWMIETFRCPNKGVPTFLFFVVIKSPKLHLDPGQQTERQKNILAELGSLCEKYPDQATLLSDFPPIDQQDFDDWVAEIDDIRNPNLSRAVTRALAATFEAGSEEDVLYRTQQKFHLKDIEPVQRRIFEIASK